jgi:hypothetical protein
MSFALGRNGKVDYWCTGSPESFTVINGEWNGKLKDGVGICNANGFTFRAQVLWTGTVPKKVRDRGYDAAIEWIQKQVDEDGLKRRAVHSARPISQRVRSASRVSKVGKVKSGGNENSRQSGKRRRT